MKPLILENFLSLDWALPIKPTSLTNLNSLNKRKTLNILENLNKLNIELNGIIANKSKILCLKKYFLSVAPINLVT